MDARDAVLERREELERASARVDGDGGRVGVDDEAVVEVGLGCAEDEGLGYWGCRVALDFAERDAGVVDGEVLVCCEDGFGVGDCGRVAEVEVAVAMSAILFISCSSKGRGYTCGSSS